MQAFQHAQSDSASVRHISIAAIEFWIVRQQLHNRCIVTISSTCRIIFWPIICSAASAIVLLGLTNGDMAGEALFTWSNSKLALAMSFPQGQAPIAKGPGRVRV